MKFNSTKQHGFGLTELMVGAAISIIASLVIFQVFSAAERQKRETTSTADSQANGAIITYMMERDMKMGGWGMNFSSFSNCNNTFAWSNNGSVAAPVSSVLRAVTIAEGGAQPDGITVTYYQPQYGAAQFPMGMTSVRTSMNDATEESINVNSIYGMHPGDLVLISQNGNCTLMQISSVAGLTMNVSSGGVGTAAQPLYNPPAAYKIANNWPKYTTDAVVQAFAGGGTAGGRTVSYTLTGTTLQRTNADGLVETVGQDIVDVQAEYGIANTGSPTVNQWVQATGMWAAPISDVNALRIRAVRFAIVTRNSEAQKPDSTGQCNTTTSTVGWSTWANFPMVATLPDWQCYRYRVFETVVPLRNIIWANT